MATIPLTGAGGAFTMFGPNFGGMLDINALAGSTIVSTRVTAGANLPNRIIDTIAPDYAAGSEPIPQIAANLVQANTAFQGVAAQTVQTFATLVLNTLTSLYNIYVLGVPNNASVALLQTLPNGGKAQILSTLIQQMTGASASIQASTTVVGSQTALTGTTPVGNAVIVATIINGQGQTLQMVFPETLTFVCTADAQTGQRIAGNEQVTVCGQAAAPSLLSPLYPAGSGTIANLFAVNGAANNSQGNLLQNSDFVNFTTANNPDNWPIVTGVAGTNIFNGVTSGSYTPGGGALEFTGDGSTFISVAQPFNTAPTTSLGLGGTSAQLQPNTVYHINGWAKVSSTPSAGVLEFDLVNGSNVVINDGAGNPNSVSLNLTSVSTSYVNFNGSFRTPSVLPSTIKLRAWTSTKIDSGKSVIFGRVSLSLAPQIYPGGLFLSIHSGNINLIDGLTPDSWTIGITNTYTTSGGGLMALFMDRTFGLRSLGLQIPYAASPTVVDGLVQ
jgi:hypothetical protein